MSANTKSRENDLAALMRPAVRPAGLHRIRAVAQCVAERIGHRVHGGSGGGRSGRIGGSFFLGCAGSECNNSSNEGEALHAVLLERGRKGSVLGETAAMAAGGVLFTRERDAGESTDLIGAVNTICLMEQPLDSNSAFTAITR